MTDKDRPEVLDAEGSGPVRLKLKWTISTLPRCFGWPCFKAEHAGHVTRIWQGSPRTTREEWIYSIDKETEMVSRSVMSRSLPLPARPRRRHSAKRRGGAQAARRARTRRRIVLAKVIVDIFTRTLQSRNELGSTIRQVDQVTTFFAKASSHLTATKARISHRPCGNAFEGFNSKAPVIGSLG